MLDSRQLRPEIIDGAHQIWFEEPDLVVIVIRGKITDAATTRICNRLIEEAQSRAYFLVLTNMTQFEGIDPTARKVAANLGQALPRRAFAIFGGSFGQRVVIDLIFRASAVFGAKHRTMRYFADEVTSRSWLTSMRNQLAQNT